MITTMTTMTMITTMTTMTMMTMILTVKDKFIFIQLSVIYDWFPAPTYRRI